MIKNRLKKTASFTMHTFNPELLRQCFFYAIRCPQPSGVNNGQYHSTHFLSAQAIMDIQ